MSEKAKSEGQVYAKRVQSLSAETRERHNALGEERAAAQHREFQERFRAGMCSVCGDALASFDPQNPCLHWLLVPVGFTKHHFMAVARKFGLFPMQLFLRRVANEEAFARNINDLSDEGTGKLIELTIRSNEYEWAFSCGEGDYEGHQSDSEESRRPHFHFQMRRKKQAFIRYNDFHIPLTEQDIRNIEAKRTAPDLVHYRFAGGEGMADLLNEHTLEHVVNTSHSTPNEQEATVKLDSFVTADEGTTLRGEDIMKAINEAKEKGVSIASQLSKLKNATVQTMVTPGDGVVEQVPRSGGRSRRNRGPAATQNEDDD